MRERGETEENRASLLDDSERETSEKNEIKRYFFHKNIVMTFPNYYNCLKINIFNTHRKKIMDEKCLFIFLTQYCVQKCLVQWFSTGVPRHTRVPCQGCSKLTVLLTFRPILASRVPPNTNITGQGCRESKKVEKHWSSVYRT